MALSASPPGSPRTDADMAMDLTRTHASFAAGSLPSSAPTTSNVRLERLDDALDKFLELIDHRATRDNVRSALPQMKSEHLENIRSQFIFELKDVIKAEKDILVQRFNLGPKLQELESLAQESEERNRKGFKKGAEELKDVWRPHLDLSTAVNARSIPTQRERIAALKKDLQRIEQSNREEQHRLRTTVSKANARGKEARDALDALEESVAGLETTPELETQIREAIEGLLKEIGPRG